MFDKSFHGGEALARAVEKAYTQGQTDYSLEPIDRGLYRSGFPPF